MPSRPSNDVYAETLAVFDRNERRYEPLTTPEVATALDANRRTVYKRLRTLVDRGELETKETGANSRVWWRPPAGSSPPQPTRSETDLEREREPDRDSEWRRTLFEQAPDGIVVHDADGEILDANETFAEMIGYSREALRSMDVADVEVGIDEETLRNRWSPMSHGSTDRIEFEGTHRHADGSTYPADVWVARVSLEERERDRFVAFVRDVTEREEREQLVEAERSKFQSLVDILPEGIYRADPETLEATYINDTIEDIHGYTPDEWLDNPELWVESIHPDDTDAVVDTFRNHHETKDPGQLEYRIRTKNGDIRWIQDTFGWERDDGGTITSLVGVYSDITERKERERELRETTRQLQGILDTVEVAIFLKDADGRYLRMNQNCRDILGVGADEDVVGMTDDDVFSEDVAAQYRRDDRRVLEANETIEIEENVPTTGGTRTHLTRKSSIFDEDGDPYAVCAVSSDITERKERERELERQREQLEALNRFNDVVHEITESVIDQSSRREIEQAVCDRLTAFDSYKFAWICAVDSSSNTVEPRAEAGVEGYLEEIPLSIDPDDPTGQGPTGTAAVTGEMQVTRNVLEDPEFEPWHEYAREYGYRSSASIPIVHEGTLYGVIGLTSEQPDAFGERERAVVARLGEVIGHAIDAVERKRALLSDDVVELAFRMYDIEDLDIPDLNSGRIVFDRILPLGDGSYLQYGTATGDAMETVRALVDTEHTPHAGPVTVVETSGDETRFELRLVDPAFLPAIVDAGGYVHEVRIEDGKYFIRVHLPPSADVRHIVDVVTDAFPGTEMVSRQRTRRTDPTPQQIARTVTERLTERQRVAIEAAYEMGFFEWPRKHSGEDVADSLEISPSTFHQHLRTSQKKLLNVIFDGADR